MRAIELPDYVKTVIELLDDAGYEAYAVGGCVRDSLRNVEPHDWDICTSALPEQITEVDKSRHGYGAFAQGVASDGGYDISNRE